MMDSDFGGIDVLLLDIEGTVCPISFVKDVLFPYALNAIPQFLSTNWDDPGFVEYRQSFPEDCRLDQNAFEAHFRHLVAQDAKTSYLKSLQGYMWKNGYDSGVLKAPIFSDVAPFIIDAHAAGKKIMIYSSGSVAAQKLFFSHTDAQPSDLSGFVSDWFDTVNAGPKAEMASYASILSRHPHIDPARWLFLSDNKEVDAARWSGMRSIPVARPGNLPLPPDHPLSSSAISEFTPESVGRGLTSTSIIAMESPSGKGQGL